MPPLLSFDPHLSCTDSASQSPDYVLPEQYLFFSAFYIIKIILDHNPRPIRWVFDNGCIAHHSAYKRDIFRDMRESKNVMYAANGTTMPVGGYWQS